MTARPEAGSRWRLLCHDQDPDRPGRYLTAHHVTPTQPDTPDRQWTRTHVIPGAVFDEVVAGSWLHAEAMGASDDNGDALGDGTEVWWVKIAGAVLWVTVNADGNPTNLTYYPPGVDAPLPDGCTYHEDREDLP